MIEKRDTFSKGASECLSQYWNTHKAFFQKNQYSKYFGNRNPRLDSEDKRKILILRKLWPNFPKGIFKYKARKKFQEAKTLSEFEEYYKREHEDSYPEYEAELQKVKINERARDENAQRAEFGPNNASFMLQNISCVDMALRCLKEGFKKADMTDTWTKVEKEVIKKNKSGADLQKVLIDLGWKSYYWNPDTTQNATWDNEDPTLSNPPSGQSWGPAWGGHAIRWQSVNTTKEYTLGTGSAPIPIHDQTLLVNFGKNPPPSFKTIPFFVGTAHAGYHVFPGFAGYIIEAHSMRSLDSINNLEVSVFNPLNQENRGGPRWTKDEKYRSGVIVTPPGYLELNLNFHEPAMDGACVDLSPNPGASTSIPHPGI